MNTFEQMPRTPSDAGLVGVALKRKKEYNNTHKHQLVNPEKLFRMLAKLKNSGNPHYQFHDDYNVYRARCQTSDPVGYEVVFNEDYANSPTVNDDVVDEGLLETPEKCDEIEKTEEE